jgi:hypothetical protein
MTKGRGLVWHGHPSTDTPRSGEQAALGADLLALMDCLNIQKVEDLVAILALR